MDTKSESKRQTPLGHLTSDNAQNETPMVYPKIPAKKWEITTKSAKTSNRSKTLKDDLMNIYVQCTIN